MGFSGGGSGFDENFEGILAVVLGFTGYLGMWAGFSVYFLAKRVMSLPKIVLNYLLKINPRSSFVENIFLEIVLLKIAFSWAFS